MLEEFGSSSLSTRTPDCEMYPCCIIFSVYIEGYISVGIVARFVAVKYLWESNILVYKTGTPSAVAAATLCLTSFFILFYFVVAV